MDLEKEIEKLKNLPPKERIERMKKLKEQQEIEKKKQEEDRKKKEKEVEDIIEASLKEIEVDEKIKRIELEKDDKDLAKFVNDEQLEQQLRQAHKNEDYAARLQQTIPGIDEVKNWYQNESSRPERQDFLEAYTQAREAYNTMKDNMQQSQAGKYQGKVDEATQDLVESMRLLRKMGYENGWFT